MMVHTLSPWHAQLRQEEHTLKASLECRVRLCFINLSTEDMAQR